MKRILLIPAIFFGYLLNGQDVADPIPTDDQVAEWNSVYDKERVHDKKVQAYAPLREADVMWSRRIWRDIDLRQKINHPFYYPMNNGDPGSIITTDRKSLIDVLYDAVTNAEQSDPNKRVVAYDPNGGRDDEFRTPMSRSQLMTIGSGSLDSIQRPNKALVAAGIAPEDALEWVADTIPFNRNDVVKWRLKEDWFFDKQRSVMDVRIIGMAPLTLDEKTGAFVPQFWVRFKEARNVLINAEVFNLAKNDAERRTYDDIFWKRMFSSTIVKEANVMDRKINQYMVGLDALLAAEEIKAEIFNIEHDLWEY